MKSQKLPVKLGKEPLIDVVCGVGLDCAQPIDTFIPGLLLKKLDGKQPIFEALPAAGIPAEVRAVALPSQNTPLMRVIVDSQFVVLIGQKWLGVACQMPYAGWESFRPMIEKVFSVISEAPFINSIERYSLKYVDFLPKRDDCAPLDFFNLKIDLAGRRLKGEPTQLRAEISDQPFVHILTVLSQVRLNRVLPPVAPKAPLSSDGSILDVDTQRIADAMPVSAFLENLPTLLDEIHFANKQFFFDLLSESGLSDLDPHYD